jgi:hypothetical protein
MKALVLATLVVTLAGCSSGSRLTRLDPTLTAAELRQGKVAVLGVVKVEEADQVRPPLVAMLERTWREERQDVPLLPADSVREILGTERDRKLLLAYEYHGTLDRDALKEIANSLRGRARYLLAARVEKDKTGNTTRGISGSDTTSAAHVLYAMGVTDREARVAVQLYDLSRGALAASATLKGSTENEHPMIARTDVVGVKNIPPEERGFPEVPDLARVLEQPFRDFARTLPGSALKPGTASLEKN